MNPVALRPAVSPFRASAAPFTGAGSNASAETCDDAVAALPEAAPFEAPGPDPRDCYFREAAERLSAALFHVVHQPTSKGRDRSLGALVALIYGPTPFGGVNSLKEVATRYGMTEQNLFQLMRAHRELLTRPREPEYQI